MAQTVKIKEETVQGLNNRGEELESLLVVVFILSVWNILDRFQAPMREICTLNTSIKTLMFAIVEYLANLL